MLTIKTRRAARHALRFTPVAVAAALLCQPALSATRTWTNGGTGPYWDLVANWNTGLPVGGDKATLKGFDTTFRTGTLALLSMSGTGTLTIDNGTLGIQAASTVGDLIFNAGTLGGTSTLGTGTFTWNGGTLGYSVLPNMTLNVAGAAAFGSGTNYLNYGTTLNLNGNSTWEQSGQLYMYSSGAGYGANVINLAAGKKLTLTSGGSSGSYFQLYGANNAVGTFNNAGTIEKNGINTFYIDISNFNNTGTINVNEGEVRFRYGPRTISGTLNVANGALLRFEGSNTFAGGVSVGGAGDVDFGGTLNLVTGGTRNFGGGGTKWFTGGTLGGAGTMVFDNLTWTGGTMGYSLSLAGVTTVNGQTTLSSATHYLNHGRTLNLNGDVTWDANGALYFSDAASVVNLAAGKTMSLAGNASSYDQIYGAGTFKNAGIVTKSGTGIFYIDSQFTNTGTVNANRGEVLFRNTRSLGGAINVADDALLHFDGTTTFLASINIKGAGNLLFEGTNVFTSTESFTGGGDKTLNGTLGGSGSVKFDNLTWLGGTMGIAASTGGVTTVTGNTTLSSATHSLNYARTLNLGDTTWDANGGLYFNDTSSAVNLAAGKTLNMPFNASSYDQIYGSGTFNNAGTIAKSGTGIFYIDSKLNNTGTLNVSKGVALLRGVVDNTGTLFANGGRIEVTTIAGLPQWIPASQTLNAGTYRVTGIQPIALSLGTPSTTIKINKAKIFLNGAGAMIVNTSPDPEINALTGLTTNSGTLSLTGGATLNTTVNLKNNGAGMLVVGSGSTLSIGAAGKYDQSGTATTYVGGTLAGKALSFAAGGLSAGNGSGLVGNSVLSATGAAGVTFGTLAHLFVDVSSAAVFDKLSIQGSNIILDGDVSATFASGVNLGTYRFLTTTTGTVLGTFDGLSSNLSGTDYKLALVYGATFVDLKVTAKPAAPSLIDDATFRSGSVTAVPEPATYALFGAGLAVLGWVARRRKAVQRS